MKRVYLDHNATTPVREEVRKAVEPFLKESFGNPSSLHEPGREARIAVETAREQAAKLIGAGVENIFFTSGGTEADNLAVIGGARAARKKGNHLVTTAIEHDAVLKACRHLEQNEGFELTVVPVGREAVVDVKAVLAAVRPSTVLVSVMWVNNEVGTIQPVEEIGRALREKKILFHTDAVQAIGHLPVDVRKLPVDLLSVSAHKIGGLKGAGALYVRGGVKLQPLFHGGSQEMNLRVGTENVVGSVSLGAACELVQKERDSVEPKLGRLRDRLWQGIEARIKGARRNGDPARSVPGTLSVSFEDAEGESILLALDLEGISASSGSACASGSVEPSHVLKAMGLPDGLANSTVRFSFGYGNTEEDVDRVLDVLPKLIERIRSATKPA